MPIDLPAAVQRAHDRAVECGAESYPDPVTGYTVLTAVTLAARGECCGSGCRHCPYPPDERRRAGRPGAGDDGRQGRPRSANGPVG